LLDQLWLRPWGHASREVIKTINQNGAVSNQLSNDGRGGGGECDGQESEFVYVTIAPSIGLVSLFPAAHQSMFVGRKLRLTLLPYAQHVVTIGYRMLRLI
jgi:hypothetical protein